MTAATKKKKDFNPTRRRLKKAKYHGKAVPKGLLPEKVGDTVRPKKPSHKKSGHDMMPDGVLTRGGGERDRLKQDKFLDFYFQGFNKVQCARLAGYSNPVDASFRLITENKYIMERIAQYEAELAKKFEISRERAIEGFVEAIDMARLQSDPDAMIKGWDKICQVMGHYAPKQKEVKITETKTRVLKMVSKLSDEELLARIGGEGALLFDNATGKVVKEDEVEEEDA